MSETPKTGIREQQDFDLAEKIKAIEIKTFDPSNAVPDFGATEVLLEGESVVIHETNNFKNFIQFYREVYDTPSGTARPYKKYYTGKFVQQFEDNKIPQIMQLFEVYFPSLWIEVCHYDEIRKVPEQIKDLFGVNSSEYKDALNQTRMTPDDRVRRDITHAKAYNTIMEIAKIVNPEMNPFLLYGEIYNYGVVHPEQPKEA